MSVESIKVKKTFYKDNFLIRNIKKRFNVKNTNNYKLVLKNISFTAINNEVTWIIGENGSGKSTWFCIALDLISKDNGSILFDGKKINRVRDEISVMFDEPSFYKNLNGYDNVLLLTNKKMNDLDVLYIFDKLSLDSELMFQKVDTFSLGQKQKLSFAIVYLRNPKYIFLDEPFSGLDVDSVKCVKELILELKEKATIIITSHNLEATIEIVDKIVFFRNGECSEINNICNLKEKLRDMKREDLFKNLNKLITKVQNVN